MLRGTLDDFTLPDVFRLLSGASKSGCLRVVRSAGDGTVYFERGEVYFAESSMSHEPLGQKLIRARAITESQLLKALDQHASNGKRVGEILMDSGLLDREQLETAVRQQIEDAAFDLLRWELGEFEWEPDATLEVEIAIAVSVENLIMEASRRLDELDVMKRKIPSASTVLAMAPTPPDGAVEINITPDEWRILVSVDGHRTVDQIAKHLQLDEFGAMRTLYGLVSAGLLTVAHLVPEAPGGERPKALESRPPRRSKAAPPEPALETKAAAATQAEVAAEVTPEDVADVTVADAEPADATVSAEDVEPQVTSIAVDVKPDEIEGTDPPSSTNGSGGGSGGTGDGEDSEVDRAAVVRELAGLFDDKPRPSRQPRGENEKLPPPKRVEDDDHITKGLINRLIDGVKGL
jgi:predicted transcriptional regulator